MWFNNVDHYYYYFSDDKICWRSYFRHVECIFSIIKSCLSIRFWLLKTFIYGLSNMVFVINLGRIQKKPLEGWIFCPSAYLKCPLFERKKEMTIILPLYEQTSNKFADIYYYIRKYMNKLNLLKVFFIFNRRKSYKLHTLSLMFQTSGDNYYFFAVIIRTATNNNK